MDSDEEPLIKHKMKKLEKIPKIILHKLSETQWETLKTGKPISLSDRIFGDSDGIYYQKIQENTKTQKCIDDPSVHYFDLPPNYTSNSVMKSSTHAGTDEASDAADYANTSRKDDDVQPNSKHASTTVLPGGPDLPQQIEMKKNKKNCCSVEKIVQCFPLEHNQNELKIEVLIPPKFLRKKQMRYGKIQLDLNNMPLGRNTTNSIVVDYLDPDTSECVNIFSINNNEYLKSQNKQKTRTKKRKPYKELNVVKAKARINRRASTSLSNSKTTVQTSTSLESSPSNVVSSTTLQPVFDQIVCQGSDRNCISLDRETHFEYQIEHVSICYHYLTNMVRRYDY